MRPVPLMLAVVLLAAGAPAQLLLRASLDGSAVMPTVTTTAGGWATFALDLEHGVLGYDLRSFGLEGTAAHLHDPAGAILATLAGGPTQWAGSTAPLSAGALDALLHGTCFVDVHTAAYPGGEIRGTVRASPAQFGAQLGGAQVVPSSGSTATGSASIDLLPAGNLLCALSVAGMNGTAAHLHEGPFGSGAPGMTLDVFPGGPTGWFGFSAPLTPAQIVKLQSGELYVDVHSLDFPGGELRGQVLASGIPYGPMSDPLVKSVSLEVTGTPADLGADGTGTITVFATHGKPLASGFMLVGPSPAAALFKDEPLLVELAGASALALHLDDDGMMRFNLKAPPLSSSFDLFVQFLCLDGSAPNGQFIVSNGVLIPFAKL